MTETAKVKARSNRLRELREAVNLTQEEVGKLIDRDFTTVSKHESGTRQLTQPDIIAYARVFKVESYELFLKPEDVEASTSGE